MLTVIIAEKETLKLFEETKMFFGPLMDKEKVAFCCWNKYGESIEEMVPELYEKIEFQKEWRAVVFTDDGYNKLNPFDYTMYSEPFFKKEKRDWTYYKERRKSRLASYDKAAENPLLKLSTALCGFPKIKAIVDNESDYQALLADEMDLCTYMLKKQIDSDNNKEIAFRLERYQRDVVKNFVPESDVDELITRVKRKDVKGIIEMISPEAVVDFIKCIDKNSMNSDPAFAELEIENTRKLEIFNSFESAFTIKDKLPVEVLCFSPRTFDFKSAEQDIKWKEIDERSYSRFSEFNLYSDKLKFLLFDVLPKDNRQYKFDEIKLMTLLLLLANNEMPQGAVTASRVYRANISLNSDIISRICENYLSKLKATALEIKEIELSLERQKPSSVSDDEAQSAFESKIRIPVEIKSNIRESELYAEHKGIGLSTDCPDSEQKYWNTQYREISKKFSRYLREPGRAIRTAVTESLRENNKIEDERSLLLSVNQTEDIQYHLAEIEQRMIESTTKQIYDTKKFNEDIKQADKEINRKIGQRMTKSKTVIVSLVALLAYVFGFMSMLFSNLNTENSLKFSLGITGAAMLVFLLIGFVYLFVLRRHLVNRIKHFNFVMSGIQSQIRQALAQFSDYLSHICNVMRDFSVLNGTESAVSKAKKILLYHDAKIKEKMETVYELFSKYVDFNRIQVKQSEPYDYDFTLLREYEYEMPDIHSSKRIEFLQYGNEVIIPVDYVDSVSVVREELYD